MSNSCKNWLLSLLICFPSLSFSENKWTLVFETKDSYHFIDIDSIYESNDFRTAWGLYDRKRMNPETQVMSAKYKKEFDCKKGKERILTIVFYTKSMADGYPIGSKNISAWKKIPFDSVSEEIFSFVCFI